VTGPTRGLFLRTVEWIGKRFSAHPVSDDQVELQPKQEAQQQRQSSSKKTPFKRWLRFFIKAEFSVLFDTASDLQEAQCFFMIASQIALIRAMSYEGTFLPASNLTQLQNNFLLAIMISMITIIPAGHAQAVLGLIKHHRKERQMKRGEKMDKKSALEEKMSMIYSKGLFSVTILLWFVGFVVLLLFMPGQVLYLGENALHKAPKLTPIAGIEYFDKCGFNHPPVIYCAPDAINPVEYAIIGTILGFPVTLTFPLLWRLANFLVDGFIWLYNMIGKSFRWKQMQRKSHASILIPDLWLFILSIVQYLIGLAFLLVIFIKLVNNGGGEDQEWSIGQIIAVLTFAPTIAKFLFKAFCKSASFNSSFTDLNCGVVPKYSESEETSGSEGDDPRGQPEKVPDHDSEAGDDEDDGYDDVEDNEYDGRQYDAPTHGDTAGGIEAETSNSASGNHPTMAGESGCHETTDQNAVAPAIQHSDMNPLVPHAKKSQTTYL
jgi:hypothetical protein